MSLTRDPAKERFYADDSYYQEALEQISPGFAVEHALLLVKPDAVVTRSIEPILTWLHENDFRVVAAQRVQLERGMVRAMWHYQLNRATPQRCRLADAIARQGASLVLLLRHEGDLPATVALSSRKGPADPARRRPGQLRSRLGDFGFLFNLVHASDEPADLVRELGILLETSARRALLDGNEPDLARLTEELYAEQAPHDLAFAPAAARLRHAASTLPDPELHRLLGEVTAEPASWGQLIEHIWSAGLPLDGWDHIVVGHAALPLSRPGPQLLPGADPDRWRLTTSDVP